MSRNMTGGVSRREFLLSAGKTLLVAAFARTFFLHRSRESEIWCVGPLSNLNPGSRFDLNGTLPSGLKRGGVFAVDPDGAPLAQGMRLEADGTIVLGANVRHQSAGVVFTYDEPV